MSMIFVAACGASSKLQPSAVTEVDTSPAAVASNKGRAASSSRAEIRDRPRERSSSVIIEGTHYLGTYVCRQGETDADLEIERVTPGENQVFNVDLVFHFMQELTKVGGAIRMHGTFDTETFELRLEPGEWIERPPTYIGVAVSAIVSHDGRIIDGKMVNEGCGNIRVTRRGR
jgi:hypothetical protein